MLDLSTPAPPRAPVCSAGPVLTVTRFRHGLQCPLARPGLGGPGLQALGGLFFQAHRVCMQTTRRGGHPVCAKLPAPEGQMEGRRGWERETGAVSSKSGRPFPTRGGRGRGLPVEMRSQGWGFCGSGCLAQRLPTDPHAPSRATRGGQLVPLTAGHSRAGCTQSLQREGPWRQLTDGETEAGPPAGP